MERPLRTSLIGLVVFSIAAVVSIPTAIAGDPSPKPPPDLRSASRRSPTRCSSITSIRPFGSR